jgi:predicted RNA-binding Zn-ribbon protein involved in translation (DUF1610 family)
MTIHSVPPAQPDVDNSAGWAKIREVKARRAACEHSEIAQNADHTAYECPDCGERADGLHFGPDGFKLIKL